MIELAPSQFAAVSPLFAQAHFGALAAGTLEGGHPGRVFVDDPSSPAAGLVCTRVGYHFLAGKPDGAASGLLRLFEEEIGPAQMALTGDPQILLFFNPPAWQPALLSAFREHLPRRIVKKRLTLSPAAAARSARLPSPPGRLRLVTITPELLKRSPGRLDEILLFWGSAENFFEHGLGVWVMDGETVVSYCESVFTGAGEAEISIGTAPGYRRKGLARLAATAFIQACLERGLKPVWGCWPENEPSVALARALGFTDDTGQEICFFELGDR